MFWALEKQTSCLSSILEEEKQDKNQENCLKGSAEMRRGRRIFRGVDERRVHGQYAVASASLSASVYLPHIPHRRQLYLRKLFGGPIEREVPAAKVNCLFLATK